MKKRWIGLCTALVLLSGVCAAGPLTSGAAPASPVDVERECSLTVIPVLPPELQEPQDEEDYWADMQNADLVADLYKIAGAVKVAGYDTYTFEPVAEYESLNLSDYSVLQQMDAVDWDVKAQEAAKIALQDGTFQESVSITRDGTKLEELDAGLYLVITRGGDLTPEEYVKQYTRGLMTGLDETEIVQDSEELVTIANTARYEYAFTPQLIALPTKPEDADGAISTANPGAWAYDREIYLKWERHQRYGSLEIQKTLLQHEEMEDSIRKEPVTFVFHVQAVLDGETVYDEMDSITFSEAGVKSTLVTGIPATAEVTVTEVYTGLSYTQVVPANQGAAEEVIAADSVVQVRFENEYNNNRTHGHGIKNQFVYSVENGGWEWHPDSEQPVEEEAEEV